MACRVWLLAVKFYSCNNLLSSVHTDYHSAFVSSLIIKRIILLYSCNSVFLYESNLFGHSANHKSMPLTPRNEIDYHNPFPSRIGSKLIIILLGFQAFSPGRWSSTPWSRISV